MRVLRAQSTETIQIILFLLACAGWAGPANPVIVHPAEDPSIVLQNPDMGWLLYENYPIDQHPHGSSTMLVLPNESFPEADAVALMFAWRDLEPNQGAYDFSRVDQAYDYWANREKELQLRMSSEPLMVGPFGNTGAPAYVLDHLSPAEKQTRQMEGRPYTVADARNPFYRERLRAFLQAIEKHFDNRRPATLIDLRGFGLWGEWHSGFRYPDLKTRRAALKDIIDVWSGALPDHLLALSFSYDPDGSKALYAGPNNKLDSQFTTNYTDFLRYSAFDLALKRKNITFRRDGCGGAVHSNERRLNEEAFTSYHRAPFVGEFLGGYGAVKQGGSNWVSWMLDDALSLHPNYLNFIGWQSEDALAFIRERPDLVAKGALHMGYRFVPTLLEYPASIKSDESFEIRSTWINRGVGRALRNYQLRFCLRSEAGKSIRERRTREVSTASWVKGETYAVRSRARFDDLRAGKYELCLSLLDPKAGRLIALALHERNEDGSYVLGTLHVAQ
jgi:hypothetical protein